MPVGLVISNKRLILGVPLEFAPAIERDPGQQDRRGRAEPLENIRRWFVSSPDAIEKIVVVRRMRPTLFGLADIL